MADWIRTPIRVVREVGREGMSVSDGGGDRRREGTSFGVNVGHPIVTSGILCVRGGDALFPNDLLPAGLNTDTANQDRFAL